MGSHFDKSFVTKFHFSYQSGHGTSEVAALMAAGKGRIEFRDFHAELQSLVSTCASESNRVIILVALCNTERRDHIPVILPLVGGSTGGFGPTRRAVSGSRMLQQF